MTPGYVYILTNPSFREDWVKIGKSSRPVDVRSKELDNTAVPLPFEIYATLRTVKYHELEQAVHKTIDRLTDLRIRQNREFFNVPPAVALDILRDLPKVADDAVAWETALAIQRIISSSSRKTTVCAEDLSGNGVIMPLPTEKRKAVKPFIIMVATTMKNFTMGIFVWMVWCSQTVLLILGF